MTAHRQEVSMFRTVLVAGLAMGCGPSPSLEFLDANNYSYSSELAVVAVEVEPMVNATMDWSSLTTDLRDRAMDPAATDQLTLLKFDVPEDELFRLFAENDIKTEDAPLAYVLFSEGLTTYEVEDMEITGLPIDLEESWVEDPDSTWLLSLMNTFGERLDILMSKIVRPTDGSTNHSVVIEDGCTDLVANVSIGAEPIVTTAGKAPYDLTWSSVTTDVYGNDFDPIEGDELLLARYDLSIAEIEENFTQLDTVPDFAKELYRMDVLGVTSADLSKAVDADGNAFAGFTTEGIWLIGIVCKTCANPAPLLLSVVEVQ
jgi:hypothetical protein